MALMQTRRIICLLTVFFFAFAVLAPVPLAAAENARGAALSGVKEFPVKDSAQSKSGLSRLGDFLARDFARTKADLAAIRARLASLKLAASARNRGERLRDRLQQLRETLVDRLDTTIDEMGLREFTATVEKITGKPIVPNAEGMDEGMVRARLARSFDESFELLTDEMERSGPAVAVEAVKEADGVVDQMAHGATPEQVVETLKARHFGPEGDKGKGRGPGFLKAVTTVLRTLFMVAACGAISLVSLGVLSYGLAAGGLVFVATGGAAVVACLYGVVYYVAACIKEFRGARAPRVPAPTFVPAFALEVAR
ncbi:MAG: hypothetical protein HY814_04875 [Candidatus Riflebacteria bacterium]|nr:hypothetical protein [Candidatus Riflebacteria bacterium]